MSPNSQIAGAGKDDQNKQSIQSDERPRATFDEFVRAVRSLLDENASAKGYNQTGTDGPNQLFDFVAAHAPGHAAGEIIYKIVRYQGRHDQTDLLKVAAWAFLMWRSGRSHSC